MTNTRCWSKGLRWAVSAACVGLGLAGSVSATDYTWQGGNGLFSDSAKWGPVSGVPGLGDTAKFSSANAAGTVTFDGPVSNNMMTVATPNGSPVVLDLGGYTYALTNRFTFETDKAGSVLVVSNGFLTATNTCELRSNTGIVPAQLTFENGGTGTLHVLSMYRTSLNVQSNAALTFNNELRVGDGQAGAMSYVNVNGGSLTLNKALWLYKAGNSSTSVLSLTSGNIFAKDYFSIGDSGGGQGYGIFNMSGGYLETSGQLWVGNAGATRGIVNMSGGLWNAKVNFEVAHGGSTVGLLNMSGGEIVLASSRSFIVANSANGHNTTGTVSITGGRISATNSSDLYIGFASNALGRCYVGGAGEVLTRNCYVGNFPSARGECYVTGGVFKTYGSLLVANATSSAGQMRVEDGLVTILSNFSMGTSVGATGTFSLVNGTVTSGGVLTLGDTALSSGTLVQSNGALSVQNSVYVGNSGSGALSITGGTAAFSNTLVCANNATSTATVVMSGGNLSVKGVAYVGNNGMGSLTIRGGTAVFSDALYVANNATSTGSLSLAGGWVTANGGRWGHLGPASVDISGGTNVFTGAVALGYSTQAVMRISGGSNTFSGDLLVARNNAGSSGELTVSGGSTLVSGYCDIGQAGPAKLTVSGGELSVAYLRMNPGTVPSPVPPQTEIRIEGGRLQVNNYCYMPDTATITGKLSLAGGVFVLPKLTQWHGKLHVTFDGGTVSPTQSDASFIENLDWFALTGNGLVVDSAGFNVGTSLVLPDAAGEHGRLVKKGAGTFTLNAANTFTGPVVVEGGTLALGSSGLVTLAGGCEVDGGALLNLAARALDFTLPSGTVSRVDGELRLASGRTLTVTNGATLSGTGVVGRVVLCAGATLGRSAASGAALLSASEWVIPSGAVIALAGYSAEELRNGIQVLSGGAFTVAQSGTVGVSLDGVLQDYVAVRVLGNVLRVYSYCPGTILRVN